MELHPPKPASFKQTRKGYCPRLQQAGGIHCPPTQMADGGSTQSTLIQLRWLTFFDGIDAIIEGKRNTRVVLKFRLHDFRTLH